MKRLSLSPTIDALPLLAAVASQRLAESTEQQSHEPIQVSVWRWTKRLLKMLHRPSR